VESTISSTPLGALRDTVMLHLDSGLTRTGLINLPIIYEIFAWMLHSPVQEKKRGTDLGSEDSRRGAPSGDPDAVERSYPTKGSR